MISRREQVGNPRGLRAKPSFKWTLSSITDWHSLWVASAANVVLDGTNTWVSQWNDISGNAHHMSKGAFANEGPTLVASHAAFSGQPVLRLPGGTAPCPYMETGALTSIPQPYTWFVVARLYDAAQGGSNPYLFDSKDGLQSGLHEAWAHGGAQHYAGNDVDLGKSFSNVTRAAAIVCNGASGKHAISTLSITSGVNFGAQSVTDGVCLGNYSDGNGSGVFAWIGECALLGLLPRAATDAEIQSFQKWASRNYGVALS